MRKYFYLSSILGLFTLLAFLIYFNALRNGFVFDDGIYIVHNKNIASPSFSYLWENRNRLTGFLSFMINYKFGALDPAGYHLLNILIHILASFAAFLLSRALLSLSRFRQSFSEKRVFCTALMSGLLFLIHPVQTQVVNYISQRFCSLTALFYFLSLVHYIYFRSQKKRIDLFICMLCASLAFLSKESSYSLPIMILFIEFFCFQPSERNLKHFYIPLMLCPILLLSFSFYATRLSFFKPALGLGIDTELPSVTYLLTQVVVVFHYLRLLIWPVGLHLDYDIPLITSILTPSWIIAAGSFLAIAALLYALRKKAPLLIFCSIFFFLALMPSSSIIPLADLANEHRLYIPLFGFCLITSWLMMRFIKNVWLLIFLFSLMSAPLAFASHHRNAIWFDSLSIWQDSLEYSPHKFRPNFLLGSEYLNRGQLDLAEGYFNKALHVEPSNKAIHNNLAVIFLHRKDWKSAHFHLQAALQLDPHYFDAQLNIAYLYQLAKKYDEAEGMLIKALEKNSQDSRAWSNLGNVYFAQNRFNEAHTAYHKGLHVSPDNQALKQNLFLLYQKWGDHFLEKGSASTAWKYFTSALKLGLPKNQPIYERLSRIAMSEGKSTQGQYYLDLAKNESY